MHDLLDWIVQHHRENPGHKAHLTVIGAPGRGYGTWCETCREYGPSNSRIMMVEEVI